MLVLEQNRHDESRTLDRHGNAYFSGIGRVKRIVLFDTLLEKNEPEEVLGILAHEVGHWKKRHVLQRIFAMELLALAAFYLAFRLVEGDGLAILFGLTGPTIYAKLLVAGFLGSLAGFVLQPLSNLWSRFHEWEADAFAVHLTGNGEALARALAKLGRDNLANLHPHPWHAALNYSHPPLAARVARLLGQG
jgi:STE24 endopeptidase